MEVSLLEHCLECFALLTGWNRTKGKFHTLALLQKDMSYMVSVNKRYEVGWFLSGFGLWVFSSQEILSTFTKGKRVREQFYIKAGGFFENKTPHRRYDFLLSISQSTSIISFWEQVYQCLKYVLLLLLLLTF